ncbi:C1 family peptidase [Boseongicola sp. H5]|uniref:C1 family peptidase n=1 Tax=Boseongicola sp. H5 TaxID=2763261 RepID=UPI001D09C8B5|nr:C1 family peptidase [Boseongicola sp. H5]
MAQAYRGTGAVLLEDDELAELPTTPTFRNYLPEAVSLRGRMPPVGDQGRQGSCVGWAVGYAARSYYQFASLGQSLEFDTNIASPAFIYDAIRIDPDDCDTGSRITDALNLLQNTGSLDSAAYSYDDRLCRVVNPGQHGDGLGFSISGWARVDHENLDQVKGELARGHPVILSMLPDTGFHLLRAADPIWRSGPRDPNELSGHAITLVGYDDRAGLFEFINSWGSDWGDAGYGFMDHDTFRNRVRGAYVIRPETEPRPPVPIEPRPPAPPQIEVVDVDLPVFDCARLRAERRDGQDGIHGFVSSQADLQSLTDLFGDRFSIDVALRPWPQCEALLIAETGEDAAEIVLNSTSTRIGDDLVFTVTTPGFTSNLHLVYFQADGQVINLFQAALPNLRSHDPRTELRLGDGGHGYPRFEISPPVGEEMIMAITTRSPLFARPRPLIETEREFLSALRAATLDLEANTGLSRYFAATHLPISITED